MLNLSAFLVGRSSQMGKVGEDIREGGSGKATNFIGLSYVARPVTSTVNRLHELYNAIPHVLE